MAQIIKIHDYISRYELDPYHYINQFVRLKKERWLSLVEAAERQHEERQASAEEPEPVQKRKKFSLKRRKEEIKADIQEERHQWFEDEEEDIHVRLPKSRVALASLVGLLVIRIVMKSILSTSIDYGALSGMFWILAFGMIVPWRIAMYLSYRKLHNELQSSNIQMN